jgi:hypothetical protein
MPDNIIIASGPSGATYNMATDYGFGTSADAHVQIVKAVYGDDTTSTRVSITNPMPVQLFSSYSGGSTASIIENGELKVKGTLNIGNQIAIYGSTASFLKVIVAGGVTGTSGGTGVIGSTGNPAVYSAVEVTGSIQGISGGFLVGVSANNFDIRTLSAGVIGYTGVTLSDSVAVQGISGGTAVIVSATDLDIRNLTATDIITVVGTTASNVGVTGTVTAIATDLDIRDLTAGTDSVAVYNSAGGTTLPVNLYAAGVALGVSGDALKVAFDSVTGVTFSVNVAADIGVSNTSGTTLAVEGKAGMFPVLVNGQGTGASVLVSATDLDIRNLTATDQVTVVGDLVSHGATAAAQITQVNQKIGSLNTTVSGVGGKVDTANVSLTKLSDSVVTVGLNKLVKTSVDRVTPPSDIYVTSVKVSGAGKPLASATLQNGVTIKSSSSNTGIVFIGSTNLINNTNNGFPILPGEEIFLSIVDPSKIFVRTSSTSSTIHVIGS